MTPNLELNLSITNLIATFGFGIAASLTPCIFPMIPITIGVIGSVGTHKTVRRRELVALSVVYVLGIALTYASFGLLAAAVGTLFGGWVQQKWIYGVAGSLLVVLGLSYFGLFELRIPRAVSRTVTRIRAKGPLGILFLGAASGLVLSPCVGPFLLGLLALVATTRNFVVGYVHLFVFALGMGMLLVVIGGMSGLVTRVPKIGAFSEVVRKFFGILLIIGGAYLFVHSGLFVAKGFENLDPNPLVWHTVESEAIQEAKLRGVPVIVDFYANWCDICVQMEKRTFSDAEVKTLLRKEASLYRVDASERSVLLNAAVRKHRVFGLPTILMLNSNGAEIPEFRVGGFIAPKNFIQRFRKFQKTATNSDLR